MASNVPLDIASAGDLVDLSIQKIFLKDQADLMEYHKDYYNVEMVEDQITKDSSLSAVDAYGFTPENAVIQAASPVQGFDKSYTQVWFTGKLKITKTMWKFGIKTRKLQNVVNSLKTSAIRTKEQILANVLNNPTSTTYTETAGARNFTHDNTGGDGVAFQSAAHTREDGGTNWSNVISDGTTNNMDFDYDALKAARRTGQAILGPIGEVLDQEFDVLVCKKHSSVHHRALEVLGALKRNEIPASMDNDGAGNMPFKILAIPYLTSDTAWGMLSSSENSDMRGLQLKQSQPLTLGSQHINNENLEISYIVDEFYQYGFNDVRNIVWSTGLNA